MKILINYATPKFAGHRRINTATGYAMGGFDQVIEYSLEDLDEDFRHRNEHILKHRRGGGYWLWKPYIIAKTLEGMREGDFLFYADAGSLFMGPVERLIELMRQKNQDILPFQFEISVSNGHTERKYTKQDAFILMNCNTAKYTDTNQLMASFSLWKKTTFSMNLVDEWLSYAQDERIITDIPNQCGKENYPGFREHRHDQSIWSLLCKKRQLEAYAPSQKVLFYNLKVEYRHFRQVEPCFIIHFRGWIRFCGYFCLRHPLKFRLNFLILREMYLAPGTPRFLIRWLKRSIRKPLACIF